MPQPRKQPLPPLHVPLEDIAKRIVKFRKLRGLTQKKLAEQIGITRDILASYESGRAHLNDDMVVRFSLALRISSDELLGLKENAFTNNDPPNVRLMRRMQLIQQLGPMDQKVIIRTIDTYLKGVGSEA